MACKLKSNFAAKNLSKLYLNDEYSDVKFVIQNEEIPANKIILAVASPVFRAMFYGPMKEEDIVQINDADVDAGAFKEFLQLFYLDEVELSMENIPTITRLADKYDVLDSLKMIYEDHKSQLNENNILLVYQLAISIDNEYVQELFETWMVRMAPSNIFKSDAFLSCDERMLRCLLLNESLNCDEIDVLKACFKWAINSCKRNGLDESDANNLKAQLGECFYLIRFRDITSREIISFIANPLARDMFSREEFSDAMYVIDSNDRHVEPKIFKLERRQYKSLYGKEISPATKKITHVREIDFSDDVYYKSLINGAELTSFRTFTGILLCEIECVPIRASNDKYFELDMVISNKGDTIYEEKFTYSSNTRGSKRIVFKNPIKLKPKEEYCIRFTTIYNVYKTVYGKWDREANKKLVHSISESGLVSKLIFAQL